MVHASNRRRFFFIRNQIDERTCPCPCRNIQKNKIENKTIMGKKRNIHFQISIGLLGCHFDPEFPFTTPPIQPQMTGPANAGCQSISTVAGFEHGDSLLGTWGTCFFVCRSIESKSIGMSNYEDINKHWNSSH